MKKRMVVPVTLAILLIATLSVGISYALEYHGDIWNDTNDTEPTYVILTADSYSHAFDTDLYFNTFNHGGTITYTSANDCDSISVGGNDVDAIPLGMITFTISRTNCDDDFDFIVSNTGTMTGTFYLGYSTSEDGTNYEEFVYIPYVNGTGVTIEDLDNEIVNIKVKMYLNPSFQTPESALATNPLVNVTFAYRISSVI